jgi:ferritin-like metal-binding protein YciE
MSPSTLAEQLTKYLTDAHSIEQQALAQMRSAPGLSDDDQLTSDFELHLRETEEHERLIREQLRERDASPAVLKDLFGTLTGKGFVAFARSQPDTTGKLVVHGYAYEHMELAAYELLARVAERAGEAATASVAARIGAEEDEMAERLAAGFDRAVTAALREAGHDELDEALVRYLADAHAIETQAIGLLERAPKIAGSPTLASAYADHLAETRVQQGLIEGLLDARGAKPSWLKDAVLRLGSLNWHAFFAAQPDTPVKLAAFAYAFEHLEIGAYELLRRVAARAGDREAELTAERILSEERRAADRIHALFEHALDVTLADQVD